MPGTPLKRVLYPVLVVVTFAAAAQADFMFIEVGAQRGISGYTMADEGMGGGVAAADFDDDGDVDLFVPTAEGVPNQPYRNDGQGQFVNIAAAVGLGSLEPHRAAVWLDIDNDHDLDLAVARDNCDPPCTETLLRLYRQDPGPVFVDVTVAAGLADVVQVEDGMHVGGMAAGDINEDGFLDLFLGYWGGFGHMLLNDQAGGFTDISGTSGLGALSEYWQPVMHDFDDDGWLDMYQAIDFTGNQLWINQLNNIFVDVAAAAGADNAMNDMGVSLGDYDRDGDFDIYITNAFQNGKHNVLYRNDSTPGTLSFTDVSEVAGVDYGGWGWGTTFLDADNDGWLDIAATNGAFGDWLDDQSQFYRNLGGPDPAFENVSTAVQFDDTEWGSGLIAFDYDRDGDLDVVQACAVGGPLRLLENLLTGDEANNGYLVVQPRQFGGNHRAIGAVVEVEIGGVVLKRVITAGTSFLSQEPAEAFFGLGAVSMVDAVRVHWPNGLMTELLDVPANQVLLIEETSGIPTMSAAGLVVLAMVIVVGGGVIVNRRRAATA